MGFQGSVSGLKASRLAGPRVGQIFSCSPSQRVHFVRTRMEGRKKPYLVWFLGT